MRINSDEKYVLDLVSEVLDEEYEGQKRFDTLRGDVGKKGRRAKLSVDAYFPTSNIIIEYKEKQHFQPVKIMDMRITISGVSRGEQRKIYDLRKEKWAADNNVNFLGVAYYDLNHTASGRLLRSHDEDIIAIKKIVDSLINEKIKSDIKRLCSYIPYFEKATKESVCKWRGGGKIGDNLYEMSYPSYDETLIKFTEDVYKSSLMCKDYLEILNNYKLESDDQVIQALDTADLQLIKAILTGYIRQERFCDGLWSEAVEKKIFLKILNKLKNYNKFHY